MSYVAYEVFWQGRSLFIPKTSILASLVLILTVYLSSVAYPIYNGSLPFLVQFFKTYIHFFYLALLGILFALINISVGEIKSMIKTFLYTSIPIHIFGIYQLFARAFDLPLAFIEYNNIMFTLEDKYGVADGVSQLSLRFENFYRATSIFSEPSALGVYASLILAFLIVPYFNKVKPFIENKIVFYLATYLALSNLLLAFSNTGLLLFFSILSVLVFIDKKIKVRSLLYTLLIIALFFVLLDQVVQVYTNISVLGLFAERLEGIFSFILGNKSKMIAGESFDTRADNFLIMIDIWSRHPISGIGMGAIRLDGVHDAMFSDFYVAGALAETGIQGVMAFTLFFFYLWKYTLVISNDYIKNNNIPDEDKNIFSILIYIVLIITIINWVTANQFINDGNWVLTSIVFGIITKYLALNQHAFIEVKLINTPIKQSISNYIRSIETKKV